MDTSIYTELSLQFFPYMVNVWVDAPSSQKMMEGISSQVYMLSRRYSFQASQCVVPATCWNIYL
jgi:hypothetical protein